MAVDTAVGILEEEDSGVEAIAAAVAVATLDLTGPTFTMLEVAETTSRADSFHTLWATT